MPDTTKPKSRILSRSPITLTQDEVDSWEAARRRRSIGGGVMGDHADDMEALSGFVDGSYDEEELLDALAEAVELVRRYKTFHDSSWGMGPCQCLICDSAAAFLAKYGGEG